MQLMRNTTAKATSNLRRKPWADHIKREKPTLGTEAPDARSVNSYIWYNRHHLGGRKKGSQRVDLVVPMEVNRASCHPHVDLASFNNSI